MTDLNEREARPRRLRRLRDVFVGPWMAETERNALEAENADLRAALAAREGPQDDEDMSFYVKAGTVCLFGPNLAAKPLPEGMLVVPESQGTIASYQRFEAAALAARRDTERPDEKLPER
jgi:hypothetical protein